MLPLDNSIDRMHPGLFLISQRKSRVTAPLQSIAGERLATEYR